MLSRIMLIVLLLAVSGCGGKKEEGRVEEVRFRLVEIGAELDLLWKDLKDTGLRPSAVDAIREKQSVERAGLLKELERLGGQPISND
jgi:hypothetical protein